MSSPQAEMKMWIISVDPMPSTIRTPVASCQASEVAAGRVSPAETQVLSDDRSCWSASFRSAR